MALYRSYAAYLRERYGARALRLPVDLGLGCPHRDKLGSQGGCIYCEPAGGRAPGIEGGASPEAQVDAGLRKLSAKRAGALLLYVQAFTGTNAPAARLRELYDAALGRADFRELIIATRPDCIDRERAELLSSYRCADLDVWVELGLQSAHDGTLERISRGHTVAQFRAAYSLLRDVGVKIGVHLIFGLPGEGRAEIMGSVKYVGSLRPDGIKIHNLHICRQTPLEGMFLRGEVTAPGVAAHLGNVVEALELLPEETVVMRLTTDTPSSRLLAPRRFCDKATFRRLVEETMQREGRRQGRCFSPAGVLPSTGYPGCGSP